MKVPSTLQANGKKDPTYVSWSRMKQRVKRGYTTLDDPRWNDFAAFFADMGPRPAGMTLEREDNFYGYGPSNCKWATALEQQRNRTNTPVYSWGGYSGGSGFWAERLGITQAGFRRRVAKYGTDDPRTFGNSEQLQASSQEDRIAARQASRVYRVSW